MAENIVEALADSDECAFDQPCRFGHRVEGHAVYCHNDTWRDGPRKCRCTWYSGGTVKDEDCPGFEPNTDYKGSLNPTPIFGVVCSRCHGARLVRPDPMQPDRETCGMCQGSGVEPEHVALSLDEQYLLEHLSSGTLTHDAEARVVLVGPSCRLLTVPERAIEEDWVSWNSVSFHQANIYAYSMRITMKGRAILQMHWDHKDEGQ